MAIGNQAQNSNIQKITSFIYVQILEMFINTSTILSTCSHKNRKEAEKKCLERLKGFSNALNNVSQQPQQQILLTLSDKRRQSQPSLLQHQGPTKVQRHHLMTSPSSLAVSSSANSPSNRVRQPITIHGGSNKAISSRLGGVVFNRRDSISLPPSPTHSLLVKKEAIVSSASGDPIGKYPSKVFNN